MSELKAENRQMHCIRSCLRSFDQRLQFHQGVRQERARTGTIDAYQPTLFFLDSPNREPFHFSMGDWPRIFLDGNVQR
jgi:hypothetical protein